MNLFVYTFWEPRGSIPVYLQLCMETWKKFLPNATIVVLDYKNIGEFIDVRELGLNLFSGRFTLPQIADAIRVALLAKHGGVWIDVDTIILSPDAKKYFLPDEKHRTIFFGNPQTRIVHIAFINTPPATMCMNLWREFIKEQLWNLNPTTSVGWDFLGNKFINNYSRKYPDEIEIIDANLAMPDKKLISDSMNSEVSYAHYYFLQNHHLADVSADMLLLHNSWSPPFFKQISPQELFHVDCTMVNVLAEALEIKLPPPITYTNPSCVIKNPSRSREGIFLRIYDGEDAQIFQPNTFVINGADCFAELFITGVSVQLKEKNVCAQNRAGGT